MCIAYCSLHCNLENIFKSAALLRRFCLPKYSPIRLNSTSVFPFFVNYCYKCACTGNDVLTVQKDSDKDRDIIAIKKDGDYVVKSEIVRSEF